MPRSRSSARVLFDTVVIATTLIFLIGFPATAESGDVLTPMDIARIRYVDATVIAPDGEHIAYTLNVPRDPFTEDNGAHWSELHVVGTDGISRPFVTGEVTVSAVAWAPDGRGISFLAKRNGDKEKCLYLIPVDGGEARRIVAHKSAIDAYEWSPDGSQIAFLAKEVVDPDRVAAKDRGFNQEIYEEDTRKAVVWTIDPHNPEANAVPFDLPGHASGLKWSPDGKSLAVHLAPTPLVDDSYMSRKVHVVDALTTEVRARIDSPGKLGALEWSPDSRYLAVIAGADESDPKEGRLTVARADGGGLTDIIPGLEAHVQCFAWTDNETIRFLAGQGVGSIIGEVNREGGTVRMIVPPDTDSDRRVPVSDTDTERPVYRAISFCRTDGATAMPGQSPSCPGDVYYLAPGSSEPVRLTNSNPWLAEKRLARQEIVEFEARDGLKLQGILIRPLDEQPGQRYPLILQVHGGPESHYSNGWLSSYSGLGQAFAARGFAVFYPNYRASTGRGVEFSKLDHGDPAGREFDDLVDAIDHFVKSGLVDRKRVGVTGGSYGGYASAWCATKLSEHFAASVMFVGLSDQISKIGTTDIPNEMIQVHFRKKPWEDWQFFLERSPIYYADQSRTPTLILHGKDDPRVNPGQSRELYRHLKMRGQAPVRLVLYPGEKHGNSKAAARLDYSLRLLRWMEHYLKGPGGEPPPYEIDYDAVKDRG